MTEGLPRVPEGAQHLVGDELQQLGRRDDPGHLAGHEQNAHILHSELVVIDDIGLLPVSPDAAEGLYRLVDAAYEKRSIAVSSNLHPSGFDEIMPKNLAGATVDRLLHHAHLCLTKGTQTVIA